MVSVSLKVVIEYCSGACTFTSWISPLTMCRWIASFPLLVTTASSARVILGAPGVVMSARKTFFQMAAPEAVVVSCTYST